MSALSKYYPASPAKDSVLEMHGIYDEQRIQEFIRLTELKLEQMGISIKTKKRLVHIMVEVMQNVYHHSNQNCRNAVNSYFILGKNEEGFFLISGNYMPTEEVSIFRDKIDGVNSMTDNELKEEYISTLDGGKFSIKGGAGLGILDIVRKSGNKVSYEFREEENLTTFFKLTIKVTS